MARHNETSEGRSVRLIDLAEDNADALAAARAEQRRHQGEEYLSAEMVDRLLAGESPLKT